MPSYQQLSGLSQSPVSLAGSHSHRRMAEDDGLLNWDGYFECLRRPEFDGTSCRSSCDRPSNPGFSRFYLIPLPAVMTISSQTGCNIRIFPARRFRNKDFGPEEACPHGFVWVQDSGGAMLRGVSRATGIPSGAQLLSCSHPPSPVGFWSHQGPRSLNGHPG